MILGHLSGKTLSERFAMDVVVRTETPCDVETIRFVNNAAFGSSVEGILIDALRDGGFVRLSLIAEVERQIVGHILFSELCIETGAATILALALAPMSVLPEFQCRGIGSQLVRDGLATCRDQGHAIVLVVGHPDFYPRFGFSAELARALESPYAGPAFMAAELTPGALAGVSGRVIYAPPFQLV